MAAGLGTRLRPYTDFLPKPLIPILGLPSIQFAIDLARDASIHRIVANSHHLAPLLRSGLKALEQYTQISVTVSNESDLLLGSGGGIRKAFPLIGNDSPFLLLNADVLTNVPIQKLAQRHQECSESFGSWITLTVKTNPPNRGAYREILMDSKQHRVVGLGEVKPDVPFYCGVAVVDPQAVAHLPNNQPAEFVPDILWPAIRQNKVSYFEYDGPWIDIGDANLWGLAHLELMNLLQTDSAPKRWTERLLSLNDEISSGIWVAHSTIRSFETTPNPKWNPPIYWSGSLPLPPKIAPNTVIYGQPPSQELLDKGSLISWNGLVSPLAPNDE